MPTPIESNTYYDDSHTWQNANDRVLAERVMLRSPQEEQLMDQALATQDPAYPEELIRENLTMQGVPSRYGYQDLRADPPTLDYMFSGMPDPHMNDAHPTDFSGTNAGMQSSQVPGLPVW